MTEPAGDVVAVTDPLTRESLAATAAHELHNIVASLRGFVELAIESTGRETSLGKILGEAQIGVERVVALAEDMQRLACASAEPATISLGECVEAAHEEIQGGGRIVWDCEPALTVMADKLQVQRALHALVEHTANPGGDGSVIRCHVPGGITRTACHACGASIAHTAVWLSVWPVQGLPPSPSRVATRAGAYLTGPVLRTLAVAHLTHCAGGHLVAGPDPDTYSLTLPVT